MKVWFKFLVVKSNHAHIRDERMKMENNNKPAIFGWFKGKTLLPESVVKSIRKFKITHPKGKVPFVHSISKSMVLALSKNAFDQTFRKKYVKIKQKQTSF